MCLGIFISGLGCGLFSVSSHREPSEGQPCSCQCHCAAPAVEHKQEFLSLRDLVLFACFSIILIGAIWVGVQLQKTPKTEPWVKGKGKRGVFGGGVALTLTIKDGADATR